MSCDERDRGSVSVVRSPLLTVEVLPPSTEAFDRGDRFAFYRGCPTLREHALVDARRLAVECYRRGSDDLWTLHPFVAGDTVRLESIDFRCPIAELYEDAQI